MRASQQKSRTHLKGHSLMWLRRQMKDPYVKKAAVTGYRARSAFKLIEMDDRYKILQPGMSVIDVGSAPGSWTQVMVERVNATGQTPRCPIGAVVALDIGFMEPVDGATFLPQADVTLPKTWERVSETLSGQHVNGVFSDMAPNLSGDRKLDHERISAMVSDLIDLSVEKLLKNHGVFLAKHLDGQNTEELMRELKLHFETVKKLKPFASRNDSSEMYLLAKNFYKIPNVVKND